MNARSQKTIATSLLRWYASNGRHGLPWRKTRDPYRILVSELMLQQTQVPRVIPKYNAFIAAFPSVAALASADRAAVLRLWQGLGYNNRAIRLHALAKITAQGTGKLPRTYDALRALPGIGSYTAGAVMSFAYNKPAPCVDVNIQRVLSRLLYARNEQPRKEDISDVALELVTANDPHEWHSALMDFGSAVCTAREPACDACPLRSMCKSKGPRPDESVKRQSAFHGSRRWWRGQILKLLLAAPVKEAHLLYRIKENPTAEERDLYEAALAMMLSEKLVAREKGVVSLVK